MLKDVIANRIWKQLVLKRKSKIFQVNLISSLAKLIPFDLRNHYKLLIPACN